MGCWGHADEEAEEHPLVSSTPEQAEEGENSRANQDEQRFTPKSHLIGFGSIFVATVSVSFAMVFSQLLDRAIPHSELTALRFSTQLFLCVIIITATKTWHKTSDKHSVVWLLLASVLMVTNQYAIYGTSYYLPIGTSCSVSKCVELTIYLILGSFVLRNTKAYQLVAVFLCIFGVILIELPTGLFHRENQSSILKDRVPYRSPCGNHDVFNGSVFGNTTKSNMTINILNATHTGKSYILNNVVGYSLVCLDATSCVAIAYIVTYRLNHINTILIVFWAAFVGVVVPLVIMALTETPTLPTLTPCVLFLLGHMLLSGTHSFFFIYGYMLVPPTVFGLITMLQIPLNFVLQYTLLSGMYPGHANGIEVSGAVIVLLGVSLVPLYESVLYFKNGDDKG